MTVAPEHELVWSSGIFNIYKSARGDGFYTYRRDAAGDDHSVRGNRSLKYAIQYAQADIANGRFDFRRIAKEDA